jgi:hypothetical protein
MSVFTAFVECFSAESASLLVIKAVVDVRAELVAAPLAGEVRRNSHCKFPRQSDVETLFDMA